MCTINHDLKAIFFHIPKTAGSYIANVLDNKYGFNNYMSMLRPDFHKFNEFNKEQYEEEKDIYKVFPYKNRLFGINNYYSDSPELLEMMCLDEGKWEECFKFTFVRDPYSRFISGWNFILGNPHMSKNIHDNEEYHRCEDLQYCINHIDEFSDIAYNHIFLPQWDHVINKDGINDINFIGKQETIEADLAIVLNKLGITEITHNKEKKVNKNKVDYVPYKNYYTQEILDFVNKQFDKDFVEFGYKKYDTLEEFLTDKN